MNLRGEFRSAWNFTTPKSARDIAWFFAIHNATAALIAVVLGALAFPLGPPVTAATAFLGADVLYPAVLVVLTIRARGLPAVWYLLLVPTLLLTRVLGFLSALTVPTAMTFMRTGPSGPQETAPGAHPATGHQGVEQTAATTGSAAQDAHLASSPATGEPAASSR